MGAHGAVDKAFALAFSDAHILFAGGALDILVRFSVTETKERHFEKLSDGVPDLQKTLVFGIALCGVPRKRAEKHECYSRDHQHVENDAYPAFCEDGNDEKNDVNNENKDIELVKTVSSCEEPCCLLIEISHNDVSFPLIKRITETAAAAAASEKVTAYL